MKGICGLAADINRCPHYIRDQEGCGADHADCGFYRNPKVKKDTANRKEPKWFEQYYKE